MAWRAAILIGAAVALGASAPASAQNQNRVERTFSATGTSCEQVTWSAEALAAYPNIAAACKEVLQRDGRYYVRFEGTVERTANRGQEVTVDFEGGDSMTLTPPENLTLYREGRRSSVAALRRGDELNFFVPETQLAAHFFESESPAAQVQIVPIRVTTVHRVAAAPRQDTLPETATMMPLPLFGIAGLVFTIIGIGLTARRRRSRGEPGRHIGAK